MKLPLALSAAGLSLASNALQQPHIKPPSNSLFRDITWGDLNFVHTTDTHGWLAGHLNQKQYSADWGDFVSFASHLHDMADKENRDLLLIDTGDKHDGNGLSDASSPNGKLSTPIFNKQNYDLVTIGNHELYYEDYSTQEYEVSVKHYGDHYVSSNVEYKLDDGEWVPFGQKYRYFETENRKFKILALSFLFNFNRFNPRTRVFPIKEAIQQEWFKNVTSTYKEQDLDFMIIYGHIPVTDLEYEELLQLHISLRRLYPNLIIHYFGGHSHTRDYAIYDHKAVGLQSGRYCETAGWASINISNYDQPKFSRRYIDFNKESFIHHSKQSKDTFDTEGGQMISKEITNIRDELNLTFSYGYVPQNYLLNEHPHGHPSNFYTFLNSSILPNVQNTINRGNDHNRIILVNSGSIRYDLYKGNFTTDTQFTISPFQNDWNYIKNVPKDLALSLEKYLNKQPFFLYLASINELASPEKRSVELRAQKAKKLNLLSMNEQFGTCPFIKKPYLKKGQTTSDDFGCDGDDVVHNSIQYYPSPNVVQTYQELNPDSNEVDVVFYSFIQPYILSAINVLNDRHEVLSKKFTNNDVEVYGGESTGTLLRQFIETNWS